MTKQRMHLALILLVSLLLLFYLVSFVGVSKAKFTTEKNVNGFSITTKQIVP